MIPATLSYQIRTIVAAAASPALAMSADDLTITASSIPVSKSSSSTLLGVTVLGPPPSATIQSLVCKTPANSHLYHRELVAYRDILPQLQSFVRSHQLPDSASSEASHPPQPQLLHLPHLLGASTTTSALLLSDQRADGFRCHPSLDFRLASVALAELGKLHAISLAMRHQQPGQLQRLGQQLAQTGQPHLLQQLLADHLQRCQRHLEAAAAALGDEESGLREELEALSDSYADRVTACLQSPAADERFAVLSHGAACARHLLFRGDAGDAAAACSWLDWSGLQLLVPAIDCAQLVFGAVQSEVRQQRFWQLMDDAYYGSLRAQLAALGGGDVRELYPLAVFHEHLQRYAQYGLLAAAGQRVDGDDEEVGRRLAAAMRDFVALGFEVGGWMF